VRPSRPNRPRHIYWAAIIGLLCAGCPEPPPEEASSLASRVELAAGDVRVQQPGRAWEQALAGMLLRHGAAVRVGSGGRALIRLDDGSAVFLRHGTEVALQKEGLALRSGQIWVDSPAEDRRPLRYRAGAVEVSASSAGFDLELSPKAVRVYVARGLAVVSATGGRSEVQSGERATIAGKAAPRVEGVAFWEDWTGGMADQPARARLGGLASGRLYAIDRRRPGSPPQELEIRAQRVEVVIRDGVARTTVDQSFFNPGSAQVEGYYWFTLPEGAAVDRFALDVSGTLVDGEVVERQQAATSYEAEVQRNFDPALLEWIDGRTYRARIFPIPAAGERRVVLSYLELLPSVEGTTNYVYPMGGATTRVQEFSLAVDLGSQGREMALATTADARVEQEGARVTMRRSGFKPQGDFLLEMTEQKPRPLLAARVQSSRGEAAYVMLRYMPQIDWSALKKVPGNVVVVVDTSAGGDDADRRLRADVAEAILSALSDADRFALVAADLMPRVVYPDKGLATADSGSVARALEQLSTVTRGGATDLGQLFDLALKRLHGSAQPALVYIGDGQPTVGELDGDELTKRLTRVIADSPARLFTIAVGAQSDHALLARLARIGGGRTLRIDRPQQAVQEALRFVGSLKTPTITDLRLDVGAGLDQPFLSSRGKLSRGQEVILLARTHHALPSEVKVSGKLGGKPFDETHSLREQSGRRFAYVPKLWARRYLTELMASGLEQNRGTIIRLGVDYGLMTPFTSFLVLESDAAYQRHGIQRRRRDPLWGLVPHAALETLAAAPLALFGCGRSVQQSEPPAEPAAIAVSKEQVAAPGGSGRRPTAQYAPASPSPLDRSRGGLAAAKREGKHTIRRMSDRLKARPQLADEAPAKSLSEEVAHGEDQLRLSGADPVEQKREKAFVLRICSDASQRPLAQRRAIWKRRLERVARLQGWLSIYREAGQQCELPHWRDRRALLQLVQQRVRTAAEVKQLLAALRGKSRAFVRRRLLRRAVNAQFAAAADPADPINWSVIDTLLSQQPTPAQRVRELRRVCEQHPTSRGCQMRLIRALVEAGARDEALIVALKVRRDGMATPELMQVTGDLLAAAQRTGEARRVYSEIVEYAPDDPGARRLLGDIYLRHGWYEAAYRQYRTLAKEHPDDPSAQLRLAAAAAGSGRVDEALRVQRRVAAGEGEPGPRDPRRWAMMWSAARIARLLVSTDLTDSKRRGMQRALRRLQLLGSPGTLVLLTWEDLDVRLSLDIEGLGAGVERDDAGASGLMALRSTTTDPGQLEAIVTRVAGAAGRKVPFQVAVVRWDGQTLRVSNTSGALAGEKVEVELDGPSR
jgi:Ca-activated chloride channel family protein